MWFAPTEQLPDSGRSAVTTPCWPCSIGFTPAADRQVATRLWRLEKQLFFDGGQLVFATAATGRIAREMMLRAGALTQSQFEEATLLVQTGSALVLQLPSWRLWSRGGHHLGAAAPYSDHRVRARLSCRPVLFLRLSRKECGPGNRHPCAAGKLVLEAVHKANDLPLDRLAEDADLWVDFSPDPLLLFQAVHLETSERHCSA